MEDVVKKCDCAQQCPITEKRESMTAGSGWSHPAQHSDTELRIDQPHSPMALYGAGQSASKTQMNSPQETDSTLAIPEFTLMYKKGNKNISKTNGSLSGSAWEDNVTQENIFLFDM